MVGGGVAVRDRPLGPIADHELGLTGLTIDEDAMTFSAAAVVNLACRVADQVEVVDQLRAGRNRLRSGMGCGGNENGSGGHDDRCAVHVPSFGVGELCCANKRPT